MSEIIKLSEIFPVTAKRLYTSWLDSKEHSAFTGGKAEFIAQQGEHFKAKNGYFNGTLITLQPYGRIVCTWRGANFPEGVKDSRLEILFEKSDKGTRVTFVHSEIPEGFGNKCEKEWKNYYLKPMKKYFKNHK